MAVGQPEFLDPKKLTFIGNLKLTSFRVANIPPPMAMQTIEVKSNIVHAAVFAEDTDTTIVALEHNRVSAYKWNLKTRPTEDPALVASKDIQALLADEVVQQAVLLSPKQILILSSDISNSTICLFEIETSNIETLVSHKKPFIESIITCSIGFRSVPFLGYLSGRLVADLAISEHNSRTIEVEFDLTGSLLRTQELQVINLQDDTQVQRITTSSIDRKKTVIFRLSPTGFLQANSRCLAKDCTSFVVAPAHLIFTTSQHFLKLVHLTTADGLLSF
jgi:elongator complex protein 1